MPCSTNVFLMMLPSITTSVDSWPTMMPSLVSWIVLPRMVTPLPRIVTPVQLRLPAVGAPSTATPGPVTKLSMNSMFVPASATINGE